jgi:hypothetical protein
MAHHSQSLFACMGMDACSVMQQPLLEALSSQCVPPSSSLLRECHMTTHYVHVQSDYRRNGQDAIWFLITDSGLIRREVRQQSR